jgi:C4-dicarboxylate-specific signal transduction histidine kinase
VNRRAALLLLAALALPSRGGDWKQEFEEVCSKTQDAMSLGTSELRSLIDRCDKLKPAVLALEESARKVYTRRLSACRELYVFVLETREQK